jgi:hypothetical protein
MYLVHTKTNISAQSVMLTIMSPRGFINSFENQSYYNQICNNNYSYNQEKVTKFSFPIKHLYV